MIRISKRGREMHDWVNTTRPGRIWFLPAAALSRAGFHPRNLVSSTPGWRVEARLAPSSSPRGGVRERAPGPGDGLRCPGNRWRRRGPSAGRRFAMNLPPALTGAGPSEPPKPTWRARAATTASCPRLAPDSSPAGHLAPTASRPFPSWALGPDRGAPVRSGGGSCGRA